MKKENLLSVTFGIGILFCIIGFWKNDQKKNEPKINRAIKKEAKPVELSSGKELVRYLMIDLLKKPEKWKNERDYLEKLTKEFIEKAKELSWMNDLPISQDELWENLKKEKLLETFEIELEKKYIKGYDK